MVPVAGATGLAGILPHRSRRRSPPGGAALARALAALHPPPRCIAWSFIDPPACDAPWFIATVHKDLDDAAVTAALAALLTP